MSNLIEPRVLKGFRDFLPAQESAKMRMERVLTRTFESYGFVPIDTPVLEYSEVLLGKGGGETDKQVYRFRDHGDRDIALRYDLTVPFARFMAAHAQELYLPFKRYHIAKVWRGENTQRGRYREFTQCDFDIVGVDTASADFEILSLISSSFGALGIENVSIRVSHRGIFNRLLARLGVAERSSDILRLVDKTAKIGADETQRLLAELVSAPQAAEIREFVRPETSWGETLAKMANLAGGADADTERLLSIHQCLVETGIDGHFKLDPSITRGLDYYTGIVYETLVNELPEVGSVCSGGRYNNLASLYTKAELPGVGASIGLDRLSAALEDLKVHSGGAPGVQIEVFCLDEGLVGYYHALAAELRRLGFSCEVYPEKKKLAAQFTYAEKKGTLFALICGEEERAANAVTVKDLRSRASYDRIPLSEAVTRIGQLIDEKKQS